LLALFRRGGDSSNTIIGIILLVMLLVFVGPNVIPGLLSRTFAFIDEGVPCGRLRQAENRANHQSLIGRSARNPLNLRVQPGQVPSTPEGTLRISIIITNTTIGTVPIVFDPNQVIVGDNGSSGVGLIFTPASGILNTNNQRLTGGLSTFPEATIRLLGPRQRCVHSVDFPFNQLDASIINGQASVQAYYRITGAGLLPNVGIFTDQGLAVIDGGYLASPAVAIPIAPPS
jgi:hypothetical protein